VTAGEEQTLAGRSSVILQIDAVMKFAAPSALRATGLDGSCSADAIWAPELQKLLCVSR
jgi:hypothetical protein